MDLTQKIIEKGSSLFNNFQVKIILINCGWSFKALWAIVSNFCHPVTLEKISVHGTGFHAEVQKLIDPSQMPLKFGGTNPVPLVYGQMPKFFDN